MPKQDCTIWKPDTCDCEILIDSQWNYLDDETERLKQVARIAANDPTANRKVRVPLKPVCHDHQSLGHLVQSQVLVDVLLEETQRMNFTYPEILSELSGVAVADLGVHIRQGVDDYLQATQGMTLEEAEAIRASELIDIAANLAQRRLGLSFGEYAWEYDSARLLKVELPERITTTQVSALQLKVDSKFGTGKVKIGKQKQIGQL